MLCLAERTAHETTFLYCFLTELQPVKHFLHATTPDRLERNIWDNPALPSVVPCQWLTSYL